MALDEAYYEAERKIEEALRSGAKELYLNDMKLSKLPDSIGQLKQLQFLYLNKNQLSTLPDTLVQIEELELLELANNQLIALPEQLDQLMQLNNLILFKNELSVLPESLCYLKHLNKLNISSNKLKALPSSIGELTHLQYLNVANNKLSNLPESIVKLTELKEINLSNNKLTSLPESLGKIIHLNSLNIVGNRLTDLPASLININNFDDVIYYKNKIHQNPFNSELSAAYEEGLTSVKRYLRVKWEEGQVTLHEAKLIFIGEGEVGKTCLMDALLDNSWEEHPSTHGIQIKPIKVALPETQKEITLNGWDFGGQRVYRPTHQLFFSAPAVYLVVWKPREGPQQGFVKEWIQLIKRREPSAKILVVATHGGPQQRQPDIDRQELWDLFGKETIIDFYFVDSKPDKNGKRKGIDELKLGITKTSSELPEVGRSVPKSFADVRKALQEKDLPYLPLDEVLAICYKNKMDNEVANLFIRISHRLGHLTHYENDPILRDIVILRPDWLATAMSYVLDDEETRKKNGLVNFSRLSQLWSDPSRSPETRYSENLHNIFLKLMERFDLSYRVKGISPDEEINPVSLIAQLVPDNNPEELKMEKAWGTESSQGDIQQTQICRIVDAQNGQSANAEGLFYQLIVRLHKYSLGREYYDNSVHWHRGLVLDDDYNGRALLRHIDNDIHITVRAPFPERFLAMLTEEVKYLVESFWEGLRCDVMVPCLNINPCMGLFEVGKLIENAKRGRPEQPCSVCNEWQSVDLLLRNAPAATQFISLDKLQWEFLSIKNKLDEVNFNTRRILSQVDKNFSDLLQVLTDEAKEGPRLFSLVPIDRENFNPKKWIRAKFRLTLWCEHSRLPLPNINGKDNKKGLYEFEIDREWFKRTIPFLKFLTGTLSLVLPVASSGIKFALDDAAYTMIEEELEFGKSVIDASIEQGVKIGEWLNPSQEMEIERGNAINAQGSTLREFHSLLKSLDKTEKFGGLVRVMNKRKEFLWVHEKFASEY